MEISREADTLRALYQNWTDQMVENPDLTIANLRSMFDEWGQPALEPENVSYKSDHIGGVEAIWFDPEMSWEAAPIGSRGRQQTYSDASSQTCLSMKVLFGMALR